MQAKDADAERARERLGEEPDASEDCTRIRFTLPSGTRIERRFLVTDTVQSIRDYIFVTLLDLRDDADDDDDVADEITIDG